MSQQLGILLMIDSAAAIEAGTLDGNIYLIDNAKWIGSAGEGTGHLVTAVNGARAASQIDVPVLNWLPYGVASPPPTLPQTFFLGDAARETLSQRVRSPEVRTALAREQDVVAAEPLFTHTEPPLPRLPRKAMDILGRDLGEVAQTFAATTTASKRIYYPNPLISNIAGEAVDLRVIYPAQYGSPDLFSDGLYWSATVDTNKVGHFAYTLYITLFYSESTGGERTDRSVTLPYVAYINVTSEVAANGFCKTPAILPA
jgi:hypothetical protein